MNVGIYLLDLKSLEAACGYISAKALTEQIHALMPDVSVAHLTDEQSPAIEGVDVVIRKPRERMAMLRMAHQADVSGEWLFLDTDIVLQQDVRDVFRKPFDIGITVRDWTHLKAAGGFTERMPYNTGVMFSRCPQFWADAYDVLGQKSKEEREWMGDQDVIGRLVQINRFEVAQLSGSIYNFPPDMKGDSSALEAKAAILHYKGPQRKVALLQRLGKDVMACA